MRRTDTIARVRRALRIEGWSVTQIVRELHVSRNTVRKILRSGETDFSYEREQQPIPRIGPWQGRPKRFPRRTRASRRKASDSTGDNSVPG